MLSKVARGVAPSAAGLNPARTEQVAGVATPLQGQSYAQLLYVDRGSLAADLVVSTTQENVVTAASAATGEVGLEAQQSGGDRKLAKLLQPCVADTAAAL
jgi:hypothetical protein